MPVLIPIRSPWIWIALKAVVNSVSSSRLKETSSDAMFSKRCESRVALGIGTVLGFCTCSHASES